MSDAPPDPLRDAFVAALRSAYHAGLGATRDLEQHTRAFARGERERGRLVEQVIIDVKAVVRLETGNHDLVFIPNVVGWTVAGYFDGTSPRGRT